MTSKDLGLVTAYAYAVSQGYTGTEEEFAELMASYATVAEEAAESAAEAAASATAAGASETNAASSAASAGQSATSAGNSATSASGSAVQAQSSATAAVQSATQAAGSATAAGNSATAAAGSATQAAASETAAGASATAAAGSATSASGSATAAAGSATEADASADRAQEILDSIPEDYSELSEDVADLKSAINQVETDLDYEPELNLIDVAKLLVGYDLSNNRGAIQSNSGWYVTPWIEVKPDTYYTLSGTSSLYRAEVDATKSEYTGVVGNTATFVTGSRTKYVRFNSLIQGYSTPQLQEGSTATSYEPYKLVPQRMVTLENTVEDINDFYEDRNTFFELAVQGTYELTFSERKIYVNGNIISTTTRISTPLFKASKNDEITFKIAQGEKAFIFYFDRTGETTYSLISRLDSWMTSSTKLIVKQDCYVMVAIAYTGDGIILPMSNESSVYHNAKNTFDYPYYWGNLMRTKNEAIMTALSSVGGHGDVFVFFTDPHWNANQKHSVQLIKNILMNTTARQVFCGGDMYASGFENYVNDWRGVDILTARGNHDQNPLSTDPTNIISDEEYYNYILRPVQNLICSEGQIYFYHDNPNQKIRYIFTDSGCDRTDTLDATQIAWIKNSILELESDWSALIIQHIVFNGSTNPQLASQGQTLVSAINSIWSQKQCDFIGIVSGHIHRDYSIYEPTYNYPIVATSCDASGSTRNDHDDDNPATNGTTSEQLFDVFVVDLDNKTLSTIRIGTGETGDRSFVYP